MKREGKIELPPHLVLTAILSGSITIVLSACYTALTVTALVFRQRCDVGNPEEVPGSAFFMNVLFRVYILKNDCDNSLTYDGLTEADSVFVLIIITMVASILTLCAAICLIIVVMDENSSRYMHLVAYVYVGICLASLVVDLTFATHFGMDYGFLGNALDASSAGLAMNYTRDILRLGAFLLVTLSLKGFVAHAVNVVLLILLVIYVVEHQKSLKLNQHSIHKMGALNAFDRPQQRRHDDLWQPQPDMFLPSPTRGAHMNPSFIDDDTLPRTPGASMREHSLRDQAMREQAMREQSMREQPIPNFHFNYNTPPLSSGARPFSYLEETRKPVPTRPPKSPMMESPPVPAPDYSPQPVRRLKSALKPGYM